MTEPGDFYFVCGFLKVFQGFDHDRLYLRRGLYCDCQHFIRSVWVCDVETDYSMDKFSAKCAVMKCVVVTDASYGNFEYSRARNQARAVRARPILKWKVSIAHGLRVYLGERIRTRAASSEHRPAVRNFLHPSSDSFVLT